MFFDRLSVELFLQIAMELEETLDVLNLSLTCKDLYKILREVTIQRDAEHQERQAWCFDHTNWVSGSSEPEIWLPWRGYPRPNKPVLYWIIENDANIDEVRWVEGLFQKVNPKFRREGWHPSWEQPLTLAIKKGRWDVVRLLIDVGYSASGVSRGTAKEDPLLTACHFGNEEMAGFLMEKKAETDRPMNSFCLATLNRMPRTMKALLMRYPKFNVTGQIPDKYIRDISNAIGGGRETDTGRTMEVIEILQASHNWQQDWSDLFMGAFSCALDTPRFKNANCLFDWAKRHHAKHRDIIKRVAWLVARWDWTLPMTKQLCKEPPLADFGHPSWSDTEGWGNKEWLLYVAIDEMSNPPWWLPRLRGTAPPKTVQYLLDIGSKVSTSHMVRIVGHDDHETLDRIIARDGCFPEFTGSKARDYEEYDRLIHYALHKCKWHATFRLIHHGERWEPIPLFVKVRLWAEATMLLDEGSNPRWRHELFDKMVGSHTQPDLEVFSTVQEDGTKEFTRQLWTLFQHTLGSDFISKCRVLQKRFPSKRGDSATQRYVSDEFGLFVKMFIEV